MENEKNKNNSLVAVIVILALLVLLLGGYIVYDKVLSSNNNQMNNDNTSNNSNNEVDTTILNNLYSIVGILPIDQNDRNNCLNMAISSNNYKENADKIFSWYAYLNNMSGYHSIHDMNDACNGDKKCTNSYGAASITEISKVDATQIIFLYNLENILDSFLTTVPAYENLYYYGSKVGDPPVCRYSIEHNTDSKYLDSNNIRIVDNQKVTEKEIPGDGNIVSTIDRIVTYDFVKENGGNYHLNQVSVQ